MKHGCRPPRFLFVLIFALSSVVASVAELPPSVYEARQKEDPAAIQIEVLRVEIELVYLPAAGVMSFQNF